MTALAFYLMLATWLSTLIGFASRMFGGATLARWSGIWLSDAVVPASVGTTVLLLVSIGITAVLENPRYRYDFSLLMFKVILASIGCAVLLHALSSAASAIIVRNPTVLPSFMRRTIVPVVIGATPEPRAKGTWPERHLSTVWGCLAILTVAGLLGWGNSLTRIAVAEAADGTIDVVSASFGANCGASKDNALQFVRSACAGKQQCTYSFDWREIGNPAKTCYKEFQVEWKCSRAASIRPECCRLSPNRELFYR